jgi:hypothetical protein
LTPPDPSPKGAWYPGGFSPCTYQVKTWFQSLLSNATCTATERERKQHAAQVAAAKGEAERAKIEAGAARAEAGAVRAEAKSARSDGENGRAALKAALALREAEAGGCTS